MVLLHLRLFGCMQQVLATPLCNAGIVHCCCALQHQRRSPQTADMRLMKLSVPAAGMTGYITGATLSSSMGRAVPITLPSLQQALNAVKRR